MANVASYEFLYLSPRSGSWAATTSKMERFVIIVNGFQPLTIITKRSILDVAAALDPPLPSSLVHSMSLSDDVLGSESKSNYSFGVNQAAEEKSYN